MQTPVSLQGQPTPISSTNEVSDCTSDEVDDHAHSDTLSLSHSTASKRARTSSGCDESSQFQNYSAAYYNSREHHESPLSGGSSSSPVHPSYGPDSERQHFHPGLMGQNSGPIGADYAHLHGSVVVTPEVYTAHGDPGPYLSSPEGASWPYYTYPNNAYRDSL